MHIQALKFYSYHLRCFMTIGIQHSLLHSIILKKNLPHLGIKAFQYYYLLLRFIVFNAHCSIIFFQFMFNLFRFIQLSQFNFIHFKDY